MKLKIPKDLAKVLFPRVLTIELNGFDIDWFLPSLYFKILGCGRARARRTNDPTTIGRYIDELAAHPALEGFQTPEGRRALERLVRTSLIMTGRVGRAKRGEQIISTVPYTLLAYKPGFPTESRRQRGADAFVYQALRKKLGSDHDLQTFMKTYLGQGVTVGVPPRLEGSYDGRTDLDTMSRLSVAFMDVFEPTGVGNAMDRLAPPSCPALVDELATDLLRYLFAYCEQMPSQALTYYLMALINLELFTYTIKLVHAINTLVGEPETLPPAMRESFEPSGPEVYLDFTGTAGSLSQQMAAACVRRDIEAYQRFLSSNILLRQLDRYAESLRRNSRRKAEIDTVLDGQASGPMYLQGLLLLQQHPAIGLALEASARADEDKIREENTTTGEDPDPDELAWIDELASSAENDIERVVLLLAEGQRAQALTGFMKWFVGVGGMTKPHGILSGISRNRRSWRYEPSNDLLAVLVQLAAVRLAPSNQGNDGTRILAEVPLQDFLSFLEDRFGILIDRPPAPFEGPEYAAAARDNLRAMLGRLRQMGIFTDLSDDFTVQRLRPPYATEGTVMESRA